MVKKILVLGASLSATSVNQQFAEYAAKQLKNVQLTIVKLEDYYPLPLYSPEELAKGKNANAVKFYEHITSHDGIVLSLAEHNFAYTAAFKNLLDWVSRVAPNYDVTWAKKPILLLSASPAPSGGANVLELAATTFPFLGATIVATFSLKGWYQSFSNGAIADAAQKPAFDEAVGKFQAVLA